MIDLHTHHERCGHAEGTLHDVAEWAWAAGVTVLGVSDHAPRFADPSDHPRPTIQMARSAWDGYVREAAALRTAWRDWLDVRVGVEVDWVPGTEAEVRVALDRPELDYVLGSVHEVGPWQVYHPSTWDGMEADAFHEGYWREVAAAAGSGLFDVLAHLDAIRAKAPPPRRPPSAAIEDALDAIADAGVAVEINGSGLRRDGGLFPATPLLEGLVRRGVALSFGSDTHRRAHLGMGWSEAVATLGRLGVTELVTFRARTAHAYPLPVAAR